MRNGLKVGGIVAITAIVTGGMFLFGSKLYSEVQEHALRFFGTGVVFALLGAIFGG